MDCREIAPYLEPYGDGELNADERLAVEAHLAGCLACQEQIGQHRRCRLLLRRQPRESAPPELRARVVRRIRATAAGQAMRRGLIPVAAGALLALAGAWAGLSHLGGGTSRPSTLVADLVATHVAYSQIDAPVEMASRDAPLVAGWFRERMGLRVTVPDYSPAGIHLLGGRIAEMRGRPAAYLLYEKGHILISVFMVPGVRFVPAGTRAVTYRGATYDTSEVDGQRVVLWSDGDRMFGLVSALDYDGLLECADRLRSARASERA